MDEGFLLLVLVWVVGAVLGGMVLHALLRRFLPPHQSEPDRRVEELEIDYRQLEARFQQLEDEVSFLRALHSPDEPAQLASSNDNQN